MSEPEEIWRDIPGREGREQVSNLGRVRSFYAAHGRHERLDEPRICLTCVNSYGYHQKWDGKKLRLVHRIVAEVFLSNPEGKPHVDHINTVRVDNRVENLRWVTPKENFENPITKARYEAVHLRPVEQLSPDRQTVIARYRSIEDAARAVKGNKGHIVSCCQGVRKTCGGYAWRYAPK